MLCIALRDVLYQGAVIWEEVRRDMDCLGMPNLAVLQAVFLGAKCGQEPKFSPDAEVRYDYV